MKNPLVWLALVIVVGGAASLYYWRYGRVPEPAVPVATAPPPPPAAAPEAPRIQHPIPELPAGVGGRRIIAMLTRRSFATSAFACAPLSWRMLGAGACTSQRGRSSSWYFG